MRVNFHVTLTKLYSVQSRYTLLPKRLSISWSVHTYFAGLYDLLALYG
jgi:hypothetical protein